MKKTHFLVLFILTTCILFSCKRSSKQAVMTESVTEPAVEEVVEVELPLKIVATFWVKPEASSEIMTHLYKMVRESNKEVGNIFYTLNQDAEDVSKFVMLEKWDSQSSIDSHNTTPHFEEYKQATKEMKLKSEVVLLKEVFKDKKEMEDSYYYQYLDRNSTKKNIVANIWVKPEFVSEMIPHFKILVDASNEESGCLYYNLHQDINDSTRFVMLEKWDSQSDIDFHNKTTHFRRFNELTKNMIQKSEIELVKQVMLPEAEQ